MICAWMVTSSAVVGSSAIRRRGSHTSAIAIITRWRMPPDRLIGYIEAQLRGAGNTDRVERGDRALPCFVARHREMRAHGFGDLVADREDRIERAHRLLEDHADAAAADLPHGGFAKRNEIAPLEQDFAGALAAAARQQTQDRQRGERLAAAAFADNANDLAWTYVERHVLEGLKPAASTIERNREIAHRQKVF